MNVDGSGQKGLTDNSANDFQPLWSPDGKKEDPNSPPLKNITVSSEAGAEQFSSIGQEFESPAMRITKIPVQNYLIFRT